MKNISTIDVVWVILALGVVISNIILAVKS